MEGGEALQQARKDLAEAQQAAAARANEAAELKKEAKQLEDSYDDRLAALKKRLATDQESREKRDTDALEAFDAKVARERFSVQRRTANMETRLRRDAEVLSELTRVQTERGPDTAAVQLGVFPGDGGLPK